LERGARGHPGSYATLNSQPSTLNAFDLMRIGITCYPTYGGSGAVATELGIALAGRGHETAARKTPDFFGPGEPLRTTTVSKDDS